MGTDFRSKDASTLRRRSLAPIALLLPALLAMAVGLGTSSGPANATPTVATPTLAGTRPNIVFILADDLDATVTPYWDVMPKTKALIADRGVTFTNSFAPVPICCPARSTILTGKYAHNTGVRNNGGDTGGWATFVKNGGEKGSMGPALQAAGYRTALIGKYMNGIEVAPRHVAPGWDEWDVGVDQKFYNGYNYTLNENGVLKHYGKDAASYSTDVVARKGVDFIDESNARNPDQPLFLFLSSTAPHLPLPAPERYKNNAYARAAMPRTPNYNESDLSDKPAWLRISGTARSAVLPFAEIDYRNRMGSMMAFDDMVDDVARALDRTGDLDNTIFVFTSDNGYNNGSHRLIHKMAPYEESLRVPLAVAGPGIRTRIEKGFVLQTDFLPTFLTLAGAQIAPDIDGTSIVGLLDSTAPPGWRTDFVAQYVTGGGTAGILTEIPPELINFLAIGVIGQEIPSYRALRNQRYTYIEWYGDGRTKSPHEYELYDLRADPYQLHNLLSSPFSRLVYKGLTTTLQARMDELLRCKGATCRT